MTHHAVVYTVNAHIRTVHELHCGLCFAVHYRSQLTICVGKLGYGFGHHFLVSFVKCHCVNLGKAVVHVFVASNGQLFVEFVVGCYRRKQARFISISLCRLYCPRFQDLFLAKLFSFRFLLFLKLTSLFLKIACTWLYPQTIITFDFSKVSLCMIILVPL